MRTLVRVLAGLMLVVGVLCLLIGLLMLPGDSLYFALPYAFLLTGAGLVLVGGIGAYLVRSGASKPADAADPTAGGPRP